jgi:protein ImuA
LGSPEVDARLGQEGLLLAGVHEIKPAPPAESGSWAASRAAALFFALALSARRSLLPDVRAAAPILCCRPASIAGELGSFYAPGLRALGIDPARLIFVEPAKAADVLWAMEEGLKSGATALVIGIMEDVALTPARRLSLASALERTPCLLLTQARSEAVAATATRWRVKPFPAAPSRFDARAPGVLTLAVELERCRSCPASSAAASFVVEWCDETRSFRVVSRLADRSDAARGSARSAR